MSNAEAEGHSGAVRRCVDGSESSAPSRVDNERPRPQFGASKAVPTSTGASYVCHTTKAPCRADLAARCRSPMDRGKQGPASEAVTPRRLRGSRSGARLLFPRQLLTLLAPHPRDGLKHSILHRVRQRPDDRLELGQIEGHVGKQV